MTDKQHLYATISDQIAAASETDEYLAEHDPATWHLIREIDDWLIRWRDDDRVKIGQYQRQCERLGVLYAQAAVGEAS